MKKIFTVCIVTVCFFSACADKEPDHDSSLMTTPTTPAVATGETQNSAAPVTVTNDSTQPQVVSMPTVPVSNTPTVATQTTATAPGMNPPHGQPGHRCDIAVGAPLNSAPTKPATQTVTSTTQTATPVQTNAKAVTAPGMNPPHGEPGHRCDIAVGAPLNSAPTKPATQTTTQQVTPKIEPVVVPVKKDSSR